MRLKRPIIKIKKRRVREIKQQLIYLVEDQGDAPGVVLAVFAHEEDADLFASYADRRAVIPRTVWHGQPSHNGYNE